MSIRKKLHFCTGLIPCIALILLPSTLRAQPHFSGFTGAAGTLQPVREKNLPQLTAELFFAGQLDFNNIFKLRTGISVKTQDLLSDAAFQKVQSDFAIEELSLTARVPSQNFVHFIALFGGDYEPIGSDLFLQRQFGIPSIASRITETWRGLDGTTLNPFPSIGGSYTLQFLGTQAAGTYLYVNEQDKLKNFNFDLRYGGVFPVVSLDVAAGFGFPIETKDVTGEEVVALVRYINFHTGFSLLFGNSHAASLFLQAGISKLLINPEPEMQVLKLSDVSFLVEPRFKANKLNFHLSLFNIPKEIADNLFFTSNPLGCDLAIFGENIRLGKFNFTFGGHLTISAVDITLDTLDTLTGKSLALQIAPFAETTLLNGTLSAAFKMDLLDLNRVYESLRFTLGYKAQL